MTAALAVEFRRLFARRLVRGLALVAVVGMVAAAVMVFFTSDPPDDALAEAKAQRELIVRGCVEGDFGPGGRMRGDLGTQEEFCQRSVPSAAELAAVFSYEEFGREGLFGVAPLLMILGLLIGASFAGAEWQAGTMTTLLTWEPRRLRVIAAKLIAGVGGSTLIVLCLQVLLLLVLLPVAATRGTVEGTNAAWFADTSFTVLRISLGAALTSAFGFSIAMIGRNTAAALGAVFAYFAIIENLLRGFRPQWQPWFVADNLIALVVDDPVRTPELGHNAVEGGLLVAAYAAVLFVAAAALFRSRDVT